MKKLGILGGMGPLATCIFYEKIINLTDAKNDQDHINTIILSDTNIPDRTDIIINNKDKNLIVDAIKDDIKIFENNNVSKIAVPCNTFHYFFDEVQNLTNIKIINMIEETIKKVSKDNKKSIAVLGTKGTYEGNVYSKYSDKYNINIYDVDLNIKNDLMDIIYNVKATGSRKSDKLNNIIRDLKDSGVDYIILACTELSTIILDEDVKFYTLDALDVLAEQSVLQMGYKIK
ncbi:aspartate/glutamate racemase family protein [Peptoniphilus stercorisuis]|uniref:Aspartate racemase n=1 Tax=Peptoniphilus stercorisuis TaxID=1436965 RepID=A0ABS4KBM9_9FIRM|nr:amino acid racemase [Peptoniphilus stercorisuis]MBP2024750.1 aspartate racemase [Peptoniphilus stercorisuis]